MHPAARVRVPTRANACTRFQTAFLPREKINDSPSTGTIQSAATLYVSGEYAAMLRPSKVEQKHTNEPGDACALDRFMSDGPLAGSRECERI